MQLLNRLTNLFTIENSFKFYFALTIVIVLTVYLSGFDESELPNATNELVAFGIGFSVAIFSYLNVKPGDIHYHKNVTKIGEKAMVSTILFLLSMIALPTKILAEKPNLELWFVEILKFVHISASALFIVSVMLFALCLFDFTKMLFFNLLRNSRKKITSSSK